MHRTPAQPKSLQMASWNINGLRGNKAELEEMLDRRSIDILALQETKLREEQLIKIRGYKVYRKDRNARGGGVALLVKNGIDHHPIVVPQLQHLEAVAVVVTMHGRETVTITSCYQTPRQPILGEDIDAVLPVDSQCVAMGDFNAKSQAWNSRLTNTRGRELLRHLETRPQVLAIGPREPTYHNGIHRPDVLDIALIQDLNGAVDIQTVIEGASDHNPILLTLGDGGNDADTATFIRRRTDWERFRMNLQTDIGPIPMIEDEEDLEAAIVTLETDIRTALQRSTEETTVRRAADPTGEISAETQQLIRDRRHARKRAQRTGRPEDRRERNRLTGLVRAALEEHRQEKWNRHLESLDPQDRSMWKTQKALRTMRQPIPPIHGERGIVYTRREKAEAFADSLELQCRENQLDDEDEDFTDDVERRVRRINRLPDGDPIVPATPEELRDIIKRLKPRKAPGCDEIGNLILKKLPRKGRAALLNIVNATLRLRHFPARWKKADVILIPKPGKDLMFPSNYRPISLLPAMSKVAERIILKRLEEHSEELQVVPDEQFAFRRGHSTELQVLRLVEQVTDGYN